MSIENDQWCIGASRIVEAKDEKGLIVFVVSLPKVIGGNRDRGDGLPCFLDWRACLQVLE